jgi:DNA-binding NtrC family response regulator
VETILLVDDDLGFVFWLGRVLDDAGYAAFPAKSVTDAAALIVQCRLLADLLIINSALPGAPAFVEELRNSRPNLEVIGVADPDELGTDLGYGVVTLFKPRTSEVDCSRLLLATVQHLTLRSRLAKPFRSMA